MRGDRSFWPVWAQFLHRWGMKEFASVLLSSLGPMNVLIAQILHAGHPFLSSGESLSHWQALTSLLEDPDESQDFAAFLREESNH